MVSKKQDVEEFKPTKFDKGFEPLFKLGELVFVPSMKSFRTILEVGYFYGKGKDTFITFYSISSSPRSKYQVEGFTCTNGGLKKLTDKEKGL